MGDTDITRRSRGGAVTVKHGDRVVTVLRVSHQIDDTEVLKLTPVIVGRAIVDTDDAKRYHGVIVNWDDSGRIGGKLVRATRTGALYWDDASHAFRLIEIP